MTVYFRLKNNTWEADLADMESFCPDICCMS